MRTEELDQSQGVLSIYCCTTNYLKLVAYKTMNLLSLSFCGSGPRHRIVSQGQKYSAKPGSLSIYSLETLCKFMWLEQNVILKVVRLRSLILCWLSAWSHPAPWDHPQFLAMCPFIVKASKEEFPFHWIPLTFKISVTRKNLASLRASLIRSDPLNIISFLKVNCAKYKNLITGVILCYHIIIPGPTHSRTEAIIQGHGSWGIILELSTT